MLFRSLLHKKLKEIEGVDDLGRMDPRELNLVPDVVIPPKFKMPKFEKYDGTKYPENHLATYCNKMEGYAHNKDLLIHVFYDSLTGAAARWYMKLKKDQIRTFDDGYFDELQLSSKKNLEVLESRYIPR